PRFAQTDGDGLLRVGDLLSATAAFQLAFLHLVHGPLHLILALFTILCHIFGFTGTASKDRPSSWHIFFIFIQNEHMTRFCYLIVFTVSMLMSAGAAAQGTYKIKLTNLENKKGDVYIGWYVNSSDF